MINYYIIDLIHHKENEKLLIIYQHNQSVFQNSDSLFSTLSEYYLKDISPILCQVDKHDEIFISEFLDNKRESILFLQSSLSLSRLSQRLQNYMEFKTPDGRTGIIRLYDPRAFRNFNNMLKLKQKQNFWKDIFFIRGWDDINKNYYIEEHINNV